MGIFDLKGGSSSGWNYSDPDKPDYMEAIEGTVVEISNPQSLNFQTRQPEFWPDGNPKRNIRIVIKGQSGRELSWTFSPKSAGSNACLRALDPNNDRPSVSIEELIGKQVKISTKSGVYNVQHPRPWWVEIYGDGDSSAVRGLVDLSQQNAQQQAAPPSAMQVAQGQAAQALGYQQEEVPASVYDQDIPF